MRQRDLEQGPRGHRRHGQHPQSRRRRGEIPLAEPEQFRAPIVWLLSDATNEINGMRYDALVWDADRPAADVGKDTGKQAGVLLYSMPGK